MTTIDSPKHLTDTELLSEVTRAVTQERTATAHLIALLAEVDARRLYLGQGYSSLFTYCTQALHLSEHAAYGRIEAARVARKFPMVVNLLADGSLNVTTIGLLAPHLTADNHQNVLERARHKRKREVECLVAALHPLPTVPSSVRKLPVPTTPTSPARVYKRIDHCDVLPSKAGLKLDSDGQTVEAVAVPVVPQPSVIAPLTPTLYSLKVTISAEAHEHLRHAQDLLRHVFPKSDPSLIVERALKVLLNNSNGIDARTRRVRDRQNLPGPDRATYPPP